VRSLGSAKARVGTRRRAADAPPSSWSGPPTARMVEFGLERGHHPSRVQRGVARARVCPPDARQEEGGRGCGRREKQEIACLPRWDHEGWCSTLLYHKIFLSIIWFHGKVGQSVRLTRERSPVRAWVEPFCLVFLQFLPAMPLRVDIVLCTCLFRHCHLSQSCGSLSWESWLIRSPDTRKIASSNLAESILSCCPFVPLPSMPVYF
jgi:hypothetical protein